jgi:hypothetical protein
LEREGGPGSGGRSAASRGAPCGKHGCGGRCEERGGLDFGADIAERTMHACNIR